MFHAVHPDQLPWLAAEQQAENERLHQRVKKIPVGELDRVAAPLVAHYTAAIDCTQCGNCCKVQEPGVTREEIETLAGLRHQATEDFKNENVAYDAEGVSFLCQKPCIFLDGTTCSIYTKRPAACADFPGLHRPRLKWRWKQVMENYSICPIVYHVVADIRKAISGDGDTINDKRSGGIS